MLEKNSLTFFERAFKEKIENYNPFGTSRNFRDQIQVQLH